MYDHYRTVLCEWQISAVITCYHVPVSLSIATPYQTSVLPPRNNTYCFWLKILYFGFKVIWLFFLELSLYCIIRYEYWCKFFMMKKNFPKIGFGWILVIYLVLLFRSSQFGLYWCVGRCQFDTICAPFQTKLAIASPLFLLYLKYVFVL